MCSYFFHKLDIVCAKLLRIFIKWNNTFNCSLQSVFGGWDDLLFTFTDVVLKSTAYYINLFQSSMSFVFTHVTFIFLGSCRNIIYPDVILCISQNPRWIDTCLVSVMYQITPATMTHGTRFFCETVWSRIIYMMVFCMQYIYALSYVSNV